MQRNPVDPGARIRCEGLHHVARSLPLDELTPDLEREWNALGERSLEGNGFLAPWFVKPAARWLDPALPLRLLIVEAFEAGRRQGLTALMPVHGTPPARSLPIRHWAAYRPLHAYSTGALVDAGHATASLQALLAALPVELPGGGALRFGNFRCDGDLGAAAASSLAGTGLRWFQTRDGVRAALRLDALTDAGVAAALAAEGACTSDGAIVSRLARKPVRRALQRLESMAGPVHFRALRDGAIDGAAIERHLALEHAGWKGPAGGSLLSKVDHARFFREVARGAADAGCLVLCELLARDTVIASTSNFLAGREAFAFKVGWDPRFARGSPGLLVDEALRHHAPVALPGCRTVDSCADPGSHLERIWDDRLRVVDGYLAWGRRERAILGAFDTARRLRDGARQLLRLGRQGRPGDSRSGVQP